MESSLRYLAILIALLSVAGCSDPKAASEKNFKVAVQNYLNTAYPRCYVVRNFPTDKDEWNFNRANDTLEALAKSGLLSKKETKEEQKNMFGQGTHTVTKLTYDLTAEGKKYYKPGVTKNLRGDTMGGFCVGKANLKSIAQFSEPADMMGLKVSRVNYDYVVTDLPAWANAPDMQQALGELKADVDSKLTPRKAAEAVVLTNTGWVHEKLFSR